MEPAYIDLALLKDRLNLRGIPLSLDPDLQDKIHTASQMVRDRCVVFDETDPPAPVRQVTLMIAMNLRITETMAYADADGRPIQVPAWTTAMTDILGKWIRDATPDPATTTAGTMRTARAHPAYSEYRRPLVGWPGAWGCDDVE